LGSPQKCPSALSQARFQAVCPHTRSHPPLTRPALFGFLWGNLGRIPKKQTLQKLHRRLLAHLTKKTHKFTTNSYRFFFSLTEFPLRTPLKSHHQEYHRCNQFLHIYARLYPGSCASTVAATDEDLHTPPIERVSGHGKLFLAFLVPDSNSS